CWRGRRQRRRIHRPNHKKQPKNIKERNNDIPEFTAYSRFPSMMKAIGITFEQIISKVIELAVKE
ncbi:hypothetical protein CG709_08110, partial [Lachnotalea glycerini]